MGELCRPKFYVSSSDSRSDPPCNFAGSKEGRKKGRKVGRKAGRDETKPGEARRGEERRRGNAEFESTTRGAASVFRSTSENRGRPIKTYSRTSLVKTLTLFSPPPPRLEQVDFAINITRLRFFFSFFNRYRRWKLSERDNKEREERLAFWNKIIPVV